jgi:S1-C subfamily serine protease
MYLLAMVGSSLADEAAIRRDLARRIPAAEFARKVAEAPIESRGTASVAGSVYRQRVTGVVLISAEDAIGTGVLVTSDGDIVTNQHVVQRAHRAEGGEWVAVWFKPADGGNPNRSQFLTARVMKKDLNHDLAIVRLVQAVPRTATAVPLTATRPEVGAEIFVIGHPKQLFWSLTEGIVSQIRPNYRWKADDNVAHEANIIQTQAPINPGNSGGPLLNADGEIVGIVSFGQLESQGLFFGIDAQHVRELLARSPDAAPVGDGRVKSPTSPSDQGRLGRPNPRPGDDSGSADRPNR